MKNSFEHFYDICHGNDCFDRGYQPHVMDLLFISYHDTAEFASKMQNSITNKITPRLHYLMYMSAVPKHPRDKPKIIKKSE